VAAERNGLAQRRQSSFCLFKRLLEVCAALQCGLPWTYRQKKCLTYGVQAWREQNLRSVDSEL